MVSLENEIKELKQSFDECDFGGGETKRMFEIIFQLLKEVGELKHEKLILSNYKYMYEKAKE